MPEDTFPPPSPSYLTMPEDTFPLEALFLSKQQSQSQQDKITEQLDLQQIVELTDSIFNIAFASEGEAVEYGKLNNIMSSLDKIDGMRQAMTDIRNISCEMSCNLLEGTGNVGKITSAVQGRLRNYSWHERAVLAIAAFAFSVGELSMLVKHHEHPMAKFVKIVKGHSLEVDFNSLRRLGLIDAMKEVARTSSALSNIRKEALSKEVALSEKIIGTVLQISTALSKRDDGKLTMLKTQLTNISTELRVKLNAAREGSPYDYEDIGRPIHTIGASELIEKIKKYTGEYEKLRNRHVLFLISDLDISIQEITVLNGLYQKNENKYEMVWLPMVDLSGNDKKAAARFTELKKTMKWIGVEPSNIEAEVVESIKKEWQFIKQAIAVSVDGRGEITCLNALPMLWTWGNSAFPFTAETERTLWNEIDEQNGWRLDLLFRQLTVPDDIDIHSWTKSEGTFVCLFGGQDMSWNQEFIRKVKYAAHAAGVSLKLVYLGVGKSKGKALTRNELDRGILVLESESQWQFWTRLESILYSRIKLGKTDRIMQEALKMVGYGGNGEAWAMFSMGTSEMVTTSGETALSIMENYKKWIKENVGNRFFKGIVEYKELITRDVHSCINVSLSVMGQVPGIMVCPECSKVMDMFYTYRCCTEALLC
ncbi:hypothetical protein V6N13_148520 [Hibiscus sabdariffa]|uniref:Uncharacterized protein n=2 Tax=Hibiscus sabdariffa TaxID=183260 RepID=A0ABR2TYY5_9ROSI